MGCWSCGKALDPADAYCRFCGAGQGAHLSWYYKPGWIAALAFFAMGPFALPLVWKTPRLSTQGRWIAATLVGLLTAYMVYSSMRAWNMVKVLLP